jgi:hypothetical protein
MCTDLELTDDNLDEISNRLHVLIQEAKEAGTLGKLGERLPKVAEQPATVVQ